jgi:hypothetical protein
MSEFYNYDLGGTASTATITIASSSGSWTLPQTVTIDSITYTFVSGTPTAKNQVSIVSTGTTNPPHTAMNLAAVINNSPSQCYTANCVYSGQTAHPGVTAAIDSKTGAQIDLTSTSLGTAGNITLSSSNSADIAVSTPVAGSNGSAADLLFFSVYESKQSGCSNGTNNGCMMAFDITTPGNINSTSTTELGGLNVPAPTTGAPTGGPIIDNTALTLAGTSQIYFVTQLPSASACVTGGSNAGVCGIQASQANP